ncbi:MAG: hypothetical protein R3293_03635 [Candidatus Promineifilaceae bacterium]|nr:hypothetical protein [Candidatus Promineifilaceae bacterium]
MTTKADYTEEEWDELIQAPVMASMLVITADLHVTSVLGEMKGMMEAVVKGPVPEPAQELVGSLVEDIKARAENKEKMEMPDTKGQDAEKVLADMMDQVRGAAAILDEKAGAEEARAFKQWVMNVAEATAEAGREGGFLGIGSVRVSDKEKAALKKIAEVLDLAE